MHLGLLALVEHHELCFTCCNYLQLVNILTFSNIQKEYRKLTKQLSEFSAISLCKMIQSLPSGRWALLSEMGAQFKHNGSVNTY